jgi:hypothetical protein
MKKSRNREQEFSSAVEVLEEWDQHDDAYLSALEEAEEGGYVMDERVNPNDFRKEGPQPVTIRRWHDPTYPDCGTPKACVCPLDGDEVLEVREMTDKELAAWRHAAEQEESDG